MNRAYYSDTISAFLLAKPATIIGTMSLCSEFADDPLQKTAWFEEIRILQEVLTPFSGGIYFEYSIPRMGKRIDTLLVIDHLLFVLEFKIGEEEFPAYAVDQVWDYALDLKYFHETSHDQFLIPVLICTRAANSLTYLIHSRNNDKVFEPVKCNVSQLRNVIEKALTYVDAPPIEIKTWENGRYSPTPSIIEAALALYNGHSVSEISRSDASAINLSQTSDALSSIINASKENRRKSICFVTGVPGAGKTLVGLNIATKYFDENQELYSVFLSGNGPLVSILREALARDRVVRSKQKGERITKGTAKAEVKAFIQNVHNFRDECLIDPNSPPIEHVALFDEAQRAWDAIMTSKFMAQKKNIVNFNISEPEFLISCLDRHQDWAVIVCLVGGGQEINTGEAGIGEWINSLVQSFEGWDIYISPKLRDNEYNTANTLSQLLGKLNVFYNEDLHLSVSLRSFRAENVSLLVKQILDINLIGAKDTIEKVRAKYPIVITRDLERAKKWLKSQARGSERYGIVVSSQAERLKPHAIDVRTPMDPIHWFLDGKEDVRSSYYLEDVATEFSIQGLELDWCCVTWDADLRYTPNGWDHYSFVGSKWQRIHKSDRKLYLKNAYRVLLTRARQGMVLVIPPGSEEDPTRNPTFYDPTYEYLKSIGLDTI
ncbi:MAG: DUF2075 domain-containing protein [Bacteroidales bacterium]|nr:DUF2075 domain-containing protein [Bacteroidales bacterium]